MALTRSAAAEMALAQVLKDILPDTFRLVDDFGGWIVPAYTPAGVSVETYYIYLANEPNGRTPAEFGHWRVSELHVNYHHVVDVSALVEHPTEEHAKVILATAVEAFQRWLACNVYGGE